MLNLSHLLQVSLIAIAVGDGTTMPAAHPEQIQVSPGCLFLLIRQNEPQAL